MSDDWEPEDGAGYIPTEEGGSGRGSMVPESALREFIEAKRDVIEKIPEEDEMCERNKGYIGAIRSMCDELEELVDTEDNNE